MRLAPEVIHHSFEEGRGKAFCAADHGLGLPADAAQRRQVFLHKRSDLLSNAVP